MERHTKMCVPHLNGAVSFLFFKFVCDFICEICCSIHPPTRRCVCCFYLYLYLYLYLFLFLFVFVFEVVDARDGRLLIKEAFDEIWGVWEILRSLNWIGSSPVNALEWWLWLPSSPFSRILLFFPDHLFIRGS